MLKNAFGRTSDNWYLEILKQGQKVEFNTGTVTGNGTICGISSEPIPLAGREYIIRLDEPIVGYDYTHITMSEMFLNPIEIVQTS